MTWRDILEREHRLLYEVLDAAEKECERIDATGCARIELIGDMIEFFRYFGEGLHDPKEEGLLYARCHKRGMTNEDEPLEQMIAEHEWCRAQLDTMQDTLDAIRAGDPGLVRQLSRQLREYVEVNRCHIEVEETTFFDLALHYLTEKDLQELNEEFEEVLSDEVDEGVQEFYESLAHRVLEAETDTCA